MLRSYNQWSSQTSTTIFTSLAREMLFAYSFLLIFVVPECIAGGRSKRVVFPQSNPTRVQIVAGFGIPVDLKLESLNIGYVFKAQYFLPYNTSELYQQSYIPIRIQRDEFRSTNRMFADESHYRTENSFWDEYEHQKRSFDSANSRWILYRSLEALMEMNGFNGRECMLRCICEVAEKAFCNESGLLNELFQIALTPSETNDQIRNSYEYEYYHAELAGKRGEPCNRLYDGCSSASPLDMITTTFLNNLNF